MRDLSICRSRNLNGEVVRFDWLLLGSDHPFRDSASYVTETAGTNQPSHSLVTQFTAKCDIGLSEISSDEN